MEQDSREHGGVHGVACWQCMGSRVSEKWIYSQGGSCSQEGGGDDKMTGDKARKRQHEDFDLRWHHQPKQPPYSPGGAAQTQKGSQPGLARAEMLRGWRHLLPGTLGKWSDGSVPQFLLCIMKWIISPEGKVSGGLDEKMGTNICLVPGACLCLVQIFFFFFAF